jgi:transglutaminase-like putative cysteine protease
MYDVQQFKPSLYLVVLLGLAGYAMAAESPGLWVFATALVLTNVWLVRQGTFKPVPRLVANGVTVLAFGWAFLQVHTHGVDSPILAIGQFLVLLQVVKVWEQRANRDYAQLLVLSLLLMVAAAISTASLLFGFIFVGYLLVVLYCCLLFHLKVETEGAHATMQLGGQPVAEPSVARPSADADAVDPVVPPEERRGLSASMRRLTGLIAAYALVAAVIVFLFFPRGTGAGYFGQFVWKPRNTLTGFSEQVSFGQVARITENNDQVATVRILRDGRPGPLAGVLLLRGYTDDYYSGAGGEGGSFQWSHAPGGGRPWWTTMRAERDSGVWRPPDTAGDGPAGSIHQDVELSPTGTQVLFAVAGANRLRVEDPGQAHRLRFQYGSADQTLRADDSIIAPLRYAVDSTGELGDEDEPAPVQSVIDRQIAAFARRPAVVGDLATQRAQEAAARPDRGAAPYVSPLDGAIADRITEYLRHNYSYTLDLSQVARVPGQDPMVGFLTDFKKGHCEYFAGAMTLMCQSLGLQARLVVGFKCDEYNNFGHYYTVRQSQAHAWVEVRTTRGWVSYDPTSGTEDQMASVSTWQRAKNLLDYMEYTWQRAVIAYNSDNRDNLIQAVDSKLTNSTYRSTSLLVKLRDQLDRLGDVVATHIVGPIVVLLALVLLGVVGWFAIERIRIRRRAGRIGLGDLPADTQARLVRQLAFYDGLVQLLARHRIARPPHLTPMEFGQSLSFLPANAYETIRRLTAVFYRIRFGGAEVDDGRQRRLLAVVGRLEGMMPEAGAER